MRRIPPETWKRFEGLLAGLDQLEDRHSALREALKRLDGADLEGIFAALVRASRERASEATTANIIDRTRELYDEGRRLKLALRKYLGTTRDYLGAHPEIPGFAETLAKVEVLIADPFVASEGVAHLLDPPTESNDPKAASPAHRELGQWTPDSVTAFRAMTGTYNQTESVSVHLRRASTGRPACRWLKAAHEGLRAAGVTAQEDRGELLEAVGLLPFE